MATKLDWSLINTKAASLQKEMHLDRIEDAFSVMAVAETLRLTNEDAADTLTDGSDDQGVDALYFDETNSQLRLHIFNMKYAKTFEKSKNNFSSNEIDKVLAFIDIVVNEKRDCFKFLNKKICDILEYVWERYADNRFRITVHFVSNKEPLTEKYAEKVKESLKNYPYIDLNQNHQLEFCNMFLRNIRPVEDRQLELEPGQHIPRFDGSYRSIIANVDGYSFAKMIADSSDPRKISEHLFHDNVRIFLGFKNQVNRKILATALGQERNEFWYLNNGVTIVCDKTDYTPNKGNQTITINNMQVVNGGQTSNALFEVLKGQEGDKLKDITILVRIYETGGSEIKHRIAESTNTQTPIKGRDLRANDPKQIKIEEGFKAIGYFYERKKNQHEDKDNDKRIDSLKAGQAILSYYVQMPDRAKTQSDRIFGELYDDVFGQEVTEHMILVPYVLLKIIETKKEEVKKSVKSKRSNNNSDLEFLIEGSFHTLYVVGLLAEKRGLLKEDLGQVSDLFLEAITVTGHVAMAYRSTSYYKFFRSADAKHSLHKAIFSGQGDLFGGRH